MPESPVSPSRRDFVKTAGGVALAVAASGVPGPSRAARGRRRYAIIGTGHRATGMWGKDLFARHADAVELVGLCDINPLRAEAARELLGASCPTFTGFEKMCDETRPELLLVATVDAEHVRYIVAALERGIQVITEKPMVVDETQCQAVLDARVVGHVWREQYLGPGHRVQARMKHSAVCFVPQLQHPRSNT